MAFLDPNDMIAAEPVHGWRGRFFHTGNVTVAHYDFGADAKPIHEHHHVQEESWLVLDGAIAPTVDGVERTVGPGAAVVIGSGAPHAARALRAGRAVVVDHPVRHEIPGSAHRPGP